MYLLWQATKLMIWQRPEIICCRYPVLYAVNLTKYNLFYSCFSQHLLQIFIPHLQIPQYILDDAIARGCGSTTHVVCTQPRRISAISVAARVSEERGENPSMTNGSVGHQIRLETRLPRPQGSILYCTTGVTLRWLINSP